MHVRGYKEKGNINTPMELAINNEIDRFSLAIDVIDRMPKLQSDRRARQGEIPQSADRVPQLRVRARHRQAGDRRVAMAGLNVRSAVACATLLASLPLAARG